MMWLGSFDNEDEAAEVVAEYCYKNQLANKVLGRHHNGEALTSFRAERLDVVLQLASMHHESNTCCCWGGTFPSTAEGGSCGRCVPNGTLMICSNTSALQLRRINVRVCGD